MPTKHSQWQESITTYFSLVNNSFIDLFFTIANDEKECLFMKYPVAKKHFASEKSSLIIDITLRKMFLPAACVHRVTAG